jgi:hypothetical protein
MGTSSMLLQCPPEVREIIYNYAFNDFPVHVCDASLKRTIGGPNRPANRRLPGLIHANKQIYKETYPVLARQAKLVFNDYINFGQLAAVVPKAFAELVRHVSLRGDVVPGRNLERFPSLTRVIYHQLGNCFFVPSKEKGGFLKRVSGSSGEEVIEAVLGRSPALVLLQHALSELSSSSVELIAHATVMGIQDRTVSCATYRRCGHADECYSTLKLTSTKSD